MALSDVPTLPCRKHGAPAPLDDLSQLAYSCYAMLNADHQFHVTDQRVWLDYTAVREIMSIYVTEREDMQDVFRLIRAIHAEMYPDEGQR